MLNPTQSVGCPLPQAGNKTSHKQAKSIRKFIWQKPHPKKPKTGHSFQYQGTSGFLHGNTNASARTRSTETSPSQQGGEERQSGNCSVIVSTDFQFFHFFSL